LRDDSFEFPQPKMENVKWKKDLKAGKDSERRSMSRVGFQVVCTPSIALSVSLKAHSFSLSCSLVGEVAYWIYQTCVGGRVSLQGVAAKSIYILLDLIRIQAMNVSHRAFSNAGLTFSGSASVILGSLGIGLVYFDYSMGRMFDFSMWESAATVVSGVLDLLEGFLCFATVVNIVQCKAWTGRM